MGNQKSKENNYNWDESKRKLVEDYLTNQNDPRLIHFKNYKFPFENPVIDMLVQDMVNSQESLIELKNYCYPAYYDNLNTQYDKIKHSNLHEYFDFRNEINHKPKGIIFFVHGFSDYVGRFAHVGQKISALGFDFYGMDQRGHGKSGGRLAYVPSIEQIANDTILFHKKVLENYYSDQEPPKCFILAHSMGCMQVLNFLTRQNDSQENPQILLPENTNIKYDAICFLNPFFHFYEKFKLTLASPYIQFRHYLNNQGMGPEHIVNEAKLSKHILPWLYDFDNPFQKKVVYLHTLIQMLKECNVHQKNIQNANLKKENAYKKVNLPIQFIIGEKDDVVCNQTTQKIYNLLEDDQNNLCEDPNIQKKNFIQVKDLDHRPFADALIIDEIIQKSIEWFSKF